jgi:hypothetical protein
MGYAVNELLRKRAEITGEIEAAKERTSVLYKQIEQVKFVRFMFDYLRQPGPQTVHQLRDATLRRKGLPLDDSRIRHDIHRKVIRSLKQQAERGTVRSEDEAWAPIIKI